MEPQVAQLPTLSWLTKRKRKQKPPRPCPKTLAKKKKQPPPKKKQKKKPKTPQCSRQPHPLFAPPKGTQKPDRIEAKRTKTDSHQLLNGGNSFWPPYLLNFIYSQRRQAK